ncbi:MAG TPA: hypothetical protein VFI39_08245 [Gemmatimonadales bacterium]|nr:hypothetical protein [Gemmatimonadales bacterium]
MDAPTVLRDVIIIGGGCYGSFYARQMIEARAREKARFERLLVVDRDPKCAAVTEFLGVPGLEVVEAEWAGFLDRYLETAPAGEGDVVIPSPLMPHLFFEWLIRRASDRWRDRAIDSGPLPGALGTPYERQGRDGSTYVSFADWTCPTHCTEPALCPVIRAPRTWEMSDALERFCRANDLAGPVLFQVRHLVHGVGGFSVGAVVAAERMLIDVVEQGRGALVVGTVSSCHGATGLLRVGAPGTADR